MFPLHENSKYLDKCDIRTHNFQSFNGKAQAGITWHNRWPGAGGWAHGFLLTLDTAIITDHRSPIFVPCYSNFLYEMVNITTVVSNSRNLLTFCGNSYQCLLTFCENLNANILF